MKTTEFERTIAMGIAEFIKFLDSTVNMGVNDPCVSTGILAPAVALRREIHDSIEKYSTIMLEFHGIED